MRVDDFNSFCSALKELKPPADLLTVHCAKGFEASLKAPMTEAVLPT